MVVTVRRLQLCDGRPASNPISINSSRSEEEATFCRVLIVALMASSVVFTTQSYAEAILNATKSNTDKQTTQLGGTLLHQRLVPTIADD